MSKIIKILGFILLFLPIVLLFFIFTSKICYRNGIGCGIAFVAYSFFSVLFSVLFFSISHVLNKKERGEKILIRENNKKIIIKTIIGGVLVGLVFLFNKLKVDGPDFIFLVIGFSIFFVYLIVFIANLFSKKQNVASLDN